MNFLFFVKHHVIILNIHISIRIETCIIAFQFRYSDYHAFIDVCTLKYIYILSIIILYRCITRRSESKKSTTLKLFCTIREKILYLHMIYYKYQWINNWLLTDSSFITVIMSMQMVFIPTVYESLLWKFLKCFNTNSVRESRPIYMYICSPQFTRVFCLFFYCLHTCI